MTAVAFECGHGAASDPAALRLRRSCPLCTLIADTRRSRGELLAAVAPLERARLAAETRVGATYEWRCRRGHDRYPATVLEVLTGSGCAKCRAGAVAPAALREAGVAFVHEGLRTRTSQTEQRLRALLDERIVIPHRVNAVRVAGTFHGRREVWPDILVPRLRIAVEYDDPGRSGRAHVDLNEASDIEKDRLLFEVGWEVIRVRGGGLDALGSRSVVCRTISGRVADQVVRIMRDIRGDDAVDAIAKTPEVHDEMLRDPPLRR